MEPIKNTTMELRDSSRHARLLPWFRRYMFMLVRYSYNSSLYNLISIVVSNSPNTFNAQLNLQSTNGEPPRMAFFTKASFYGILGIVHIKCRIQVTRKADWIMQNASI